MSGHLTEAQLAELVAGVAPDHGDPALAHLEQCPECRTDLQERRGNEQLFTELAKVIGKPTVRVAPLGCSVFRHPAMASSSNQNVNWPLATRARL